MKPIAIIGPTASGKTSLSYLIAKQFLPQTPSIISCDSQLIYRGLDIGTAKPSQEELKQFPHYGVNLVAPDIQFSAADYTKAIRPIYDQLKQDQQPIIIVGGTGFYLRSLLLPEHLPQIARNPEYRTQLLTEAKNQPAEYLYQKLQQLDPSRASAIYSNDTQRILRALEIIQTTGQPVQASPTQWQEDIHLIGLYFKNKETHYELIQQRTQAMFDNGLLAETQKLLETYDGNCFALKNAIGYPEAIEVLHGNITQTEAIESISIQTRQYAKRQMTWFKKIETIQWYAVDDQPIEDIAHEISNRFFVENP